VIAAAEYWALFFHVCGAFQFVSGTRRR